MFGGQNWTGDATFVLIMHDLCTYCTLYCVCMITSTIIGEQQVNRGAAAEMDAIREQFSLATRDYSARWNTTTLGCWCVRVGVIPDSHRSGEDL